MKTMHFIVIIGLMVTCSASWAAELRQGDRYIVNGNFQAKILPSGDSKMIERENRILIVDITNNKVTFDLTSIREGHPEADTMLNSYFEVDISGFRLDQYVRDWDAIGHGALVVPFKISFKDGTLSTRSVSLGYYVQWPRYLSSGGVAYGPIASVGLTSITRDESENTELGATAALGFVMSIQSKMQLGIVLGIDHLGDDTWEYEDSGWASVMIGFNFLQ